jgi:paraquat-inducible protein B
MPTEQIVRGPWGRPRVLTVGLALCLAFLGCAKAPEAEMKTAQGLLDAARAAGGASYAAESFTKAEAAVARARTEIEVQQGKFRLLRSYDKAEKLIAQARTEAERAKADIATGRVQAQQDAQLAVEQAKADLAAATAAVANAPAGKDSRADVEAMRGDLDGLRAALAEAESAFGSGDYATSRQKAEQVRQSASAISADVARAVQKTRG